MSGSIDTPVAIFAFNRPELTARVFSAIAGARPKRLYLFVDGPRPDVLGDREKVAEVKSVLRQVDWVCDVVSDYAEHNLGCFDRIVSGLNRVFAVEESAIILEDDCLPHSGFFGFCEELLCRYRHNERILAIRGIDHPAQDPWTDFSYYFSHWFKPWGWATWRRSWENHDPDLKSWPTFVEGGGVESHLGDIPGEAAYLKQVINGQYRQNVERHWDWGFQATGWMGDQLVIAPRRNLVSNIGFGGGATHVKDAADHRGNLPTYDPGPMIHPERIERNREADAYTFRFDQGFPMNAEKGSLSSDEWIEQRRQLEERILILNAHLEAKEEVIRQQHRDLLRLQGIE